MKRFVTTATTQEIARVGEVRYFFVPNRSFQWIENLHGRFDQGSDSVTSVFDSGLFSRVFFYSLTAFKRPDTFGQIVQALIFTFVIQSLVVGMGTLLVVTGERFFSIGLWDRKSETLWSAVIAVLLGFLSCHIASSDKLHALLRRLKITRQSSYPCE